MKNSLKYLFSFIFVFTSCFAIAQSNLSFADSIRVNYKIPELAYAVLSSDSVLELNVLGFKQQNKVVKASLNDRFRIGSNTKTITAYIAAVMVKQGKLKWDTKFFDLFPELKESSDTSYHNCTLQDLITFRINLMSWTYTYDDPEKNEIKGNNQQQRYSFIKWVLKQKPDTIKKITYWSNPSYVAAGLMLEKVSAKSYEQLVADLGRELNISFAFGQPNVVGKSQPWGHNAELKPEKPQLNEKLNWLSSAGNINVSLPDYAKFIQMQLQGLLGKSKIFTANEFDYMHYGLEKFSFGWQVFVDNKTNLKYSYHKGNPGTFLSQVYICKETNRAYIFFANVQSEQAEVGMKVLFNKLNAQYSK